MELRERIEAARKELKLTNEYCKKLKICDSNNLNPAGSQEIIVRGNKMNKYVLTEIHDNIFRENIIHGDDSPYQYRNKEKIVTEKEYFDLLPEIMPSNLAERKQWNDWIINCHWQIHNNSPNQRVATFQKKALMLSTHTKEFLLHEIEFVESSLKENRISGSHDLTNIFTFEQLEIVAEIESNREYLNNIKKTSKITKEQVQIKNQNQVSENLLKPDKKSLALFDIWEADKNGNKEQYYRIIEVLKNTSFTGSPFITEINGKLIWNKVPAKGYVQYLAGFIYTCFQKKWIKSTYSAPQLTTILSNTFNINICIIIHV